MRKKGVTLVEIMVSTILVVLIVAGMAHVFVTARRYAALNRSRMQAMEFNKQILDGFAQSVRQDTWTDLTNPLGRNIENQPNATTTYNAIAYNSTFNVTAAPPLYGSDKIPALRKVKLIINWTEPVQ